MPARGVDKRERDYYALIGVARTADIVEIRQAYLSLIKRFHPDLQTLGSARDQASNFVATLNVAYATLRDAPRRAVYDAELDRRRAAAQRRADERQRARDHRTPNWPEPRTALLPGRRHAKRETTELRRFVVSFVATSVVLVFFLLCLNGVVSDAAIWPFGETNEPTEHTGQVMTEARLKPLAVHAVRTAMSLPLDQAGSYSRRCFADASNRGELKANLQCVMFDDAVLLVNGPQDDHAQPYFRLNWCRARHLDALASFGLDRDDLLTRLQTLTAQQVVQSIAQQSSVPADPKS